ncbi:amidohydrolase family protein [Arenimonas sp.]|uniref:metal-dependent hydrolase family protein n=1 Tax=Arenimonas sp. TaxID=1872635 RepID=UPI0035AE87CE
MKFRTALLALPLLAAAFDARAGALLVQAGQLLDRPGQAPRGAATLYIVDGRVAEVRDGHLGAGAFGAPADTEVLDLRRHFVLPGLIDSHVHLTNDLGGLAGQLAQVQRSPADNALEAATNARKTLRAGFTTVRNLGDGDGEIRALRDAINAGKLPGPRILTANTSISATAGHGDPRLGFRGDLHEALDAGNVCDGVESCRRAVRSQVAGGADVIKLLITGGVNSRIGAGLGAQMFEDEARAVVETSRMYGKKVAVHAHGADGINLALRLGMDSIEHGTLLDREGLELFRRSGAYYVPTLSTVNGYRERLAANPEAYQGEVLAKIRWRIDITGKALEQAVPAGVKIAFGTDAGVSLHGRNADEFELMVAHGMTPAQAIVAATGNAADLLGLGDSVGSLEPGKHADLIAVGGNPLEDVTVLKRVDVVVKGGEVFRP